MTPAEPAPTRGQKPPTLPERLTPGLPVTMYRMETGLEHYEVHVTDRGEKGDADVSRPVGGLVVPCKVFSRDRELARDLAAEIAARYNAHAGLTAALDDLLDIIENEIAYSVDDEMEHCRDYARRVIKARALLAAVRGQP